MNTEYVWWFLGVLLAGGGLAAFLLFGQVPEIEDETVGHLADREPHNPPVSTTTPGPGAPASTSDTP